MAELNIERLFRTAHGLLNVEIRITEADRNNALTEPDASVVIAILKWLGSFPQARG